MFSSPKGGTLPSLLSHLSGLSCNCSFVHVHYKHNMIDQRLQSLVCIYSIFLLEIFLFPSCLLSSWQDVGTLLSPEYHNKQFYHHCEISCITLADRQLLELNFFFFFSCFSASSCVWVSFFMILVQSLLLSSLSAPTLSWLRIPPVTFPLFSGCFFWHYHQWFAGIFILCTLPPAVTALTMKKKQKSLVFSTEGRWFCVGF